MTAPAFLHAARAGMPMISSSNMVPTVCGLTRFALVRAPPPPPLSLHSSLPQARDLRKGESLPRILFVVTGRGAGRAAYEARLHATAFSHVAFRLLWLATPDYRLMLGSADLGICLHASSSGLDLPMKVGRGGGSGFCCGGRGGWRRWERRGWSRGGSVMLRCMRPRRPLAHGLGEAMWSPAKQSSVFSKNCSLPASALQLVSHPAITPTLARPIPRQVVDMFGSGVPVCALQYPTITELVQPGVNGVLFATAEALAAQLLSLLAGWPERAGQLVELRRGAEAERARGWDEEWGRCVLPVLQGAET